MFIRGVTQFYLSLSLSAILNVYTVSSYLLTPVQLSWSGNNLSYAVNISAMLGMLAVLYIPIKAYNIIYRTADLNSEEFKKRYKTIISGLRTDNPLAYQFICVFFFRRAVYASIFVLFSSKPVYQIICANAITIAMMVYVVVVRPYNTFLSTILSILNEMLLVGMILITFRFLNPTISPALSKTIGTLLITIILVTIILNWVGIMLYGISQYIHKKMRAQRLKKLKAAQKEIENIQWVSSNISRVSHARIITTSQS